ncbi:hypothetical protein [Roseicyclus sp.]|uniref:hypothetical protein n=1 Tax=Roseicyclus sp. TaxID=1914329 RepID=UPI003F9EF907
MVIKRFVAEEQGGVSTIDWLVLLGALSTAGFALVDVTSGALRDHSQTIRGELQDPYFETAWVDSLPVGPSGQGMPGISPGGTVSNPTTPGGGGPNGNNGHGNDADGNDNSNPGASNDPNDNTDDDGTPPGQTDPAPTDPEPEPQPEPEPEPTDPGEGVTGDDETDTSGSSGGGGVTEPEGPVVPASNVAGCPAPDLYMAEPDVREGEELEENRIRLRNQTVGGASTHLSACPGINGTGYFHANPTYTLDLSDMEDFWRLEVRLNSSCDTTLLVQDAAGNFHFDDDSGPGNNGRVRLFNMANLEGRVNIWVGTYWNQTCDDTELRITLDD